MKLNVLDKKGKNVGEVTLSDAVFGVTPNEDVLTRYLRILTHNQRQGTSKVKTRGEVSGGGKKPWRQKKTGRARHGSTRSPLWVGGGITHGPTPKSWTLIFPRKMRTLAIKSALSYQFINKKALIVDKFELKEPKTKALVDLLSSLKKRNISINPITLPIDVLLDLEMKGKRWILDKDFLDAINTFMRIKEVNPDKPFKQEEAVYEIAKQYEKSLYKESIVILTLNKNLYLASKKIFPLTPKDVLFTIIFIYGLLKIKTKSGRDIIATKDHPFYSTKAREE